MKKLLKILLFVLVIVASIWAKQSGLFEAFLGAIKNLGMWAQPAFLGVFILSCLLFFPSLVLTLTAGALFSYPAAVLLCLVGNSLGAVAALCVGRYGLRDWVKRKADSNARFQKLNQIVSQEGWRVMVLARLTPIFPFSIGNYLFGATSISVLSYGSAAFLGSIPSTCVYVWAGHLTGGAASGERGPLEWGLLALGIVATIALSFYLKKILDRTN